MQKSDVIRLVIGRPAPDFRLPSSGGPVLCLSAFRGKKNVLVCFFPAAFTGVCTDEMCSFSTNIRHYARTGTEIIAISGDHVASLREFRNKEKLQVQLLSDLKRDTARAYGVLDEDKCLPRRSYFLVDRLGNLRWSHIEASDAHRRAEEELMREIAKLDEVAAPLSAARV